jgi:hypothetical protein
LNEKLKAKQNTTTMIFQTANNVTTIGCQTAGADGNVSTIEFIGGYNVCQVLEFFIQIKWKLKEKELKDIEIPDNKRRIQEGKDEVLEKQLK